MEDIFSMDNEYNLENCFELDPILEQAHTIAHKVETVLLPAFDDKSIHISQGTEEVTQLAEFYSSLYQNSKNYMKSVMQSELEKEINQNSTHYYLKLKGEICAALRVSRTPFESKHYFPGLEFDDSYLELSRLGAKPFAIRLNAASLLVISAARDGLIQGYKGLYAMVRQQDKKQYERYGMLECATAIQIPARNQGLYSVLSADWLRLLSSTRLVAERLERVSMKYMLRSK